MSPGRILKLAAATLVALVCLPSAAQAFSENGCPQGYVAFDRQRGQGSAPAYLPGETVAASGYLTDPRATGRTVTLRWGSETGPVLGEATMEADGRWRGIEFAIPDDAAHQLQSLFLEARDESGEVFPGLPIRARLRVGPPGQPEVAAPENVRRPSRRAKQPDVRANREPAAPQARLTLPAPRAAAQTSLASAAPASRRAAQRRDRTAARGSRTAPPRAQVPRRAPVPRVSSESARPPVAAQPARGLEWLLAAALSACLGALVALGLRRRSRGDDDAEYAELSLEAELQEIVAEQRARELAKSGREPVARP